MFGHAALSQSCNNNECMVGLLVNALPLVEQEVVAGQPLSLGVSMWTGSVISVQNKKSSRIYIYIFRKARQQLEVVSRVPFRDRMRGAESERGRKTTSLGERPKKIPSILAPFFDFSRPGMVKNHSVYLHFH